MRGGDHRSEGLFSYVSCEARVPADHPLRAIRAIVDEALEVMSADFDRMYSRIGRPSIPPEKLLRALLLQAFYTIRSERQLMEQMDYSLLFRWFVGLAMDAPIWDVTVFTKNRERLLGGDVAAKFLAAIVGQSRVQALLSDDHFSVDGTLIDAWASMKSFKPKQGEASSGDDDGNGGASGAGGSGLAKAKRRNAERDFHGEKRSNATHASTTDPDARLFKKARGEAAPPSYSRKLRPPIRSAPRAASTSMTAQSVADGSSASRVQDPKHNCRGDIPGTCGEVRVGYLARCPERQDAAEPERELPG
jgi:transposase